MKPKVTIVKRIAAFLMVPSCTARFISARFCRLALVLTIIALRLAGTTPQLAQILIPFGAEPVPLDTGLQIPPGNTLPLPSLLTSERFVLGPSPSPALDPVLHGNSRLYCMSSKLRG